MQNTPALVGIVLLNSTRSPLMYRIPNLVFLLPLVALLQGCATSSGGGVLDKPLEMFGLKKPESTSLELPPTDRKVALRIHAGERLNTDLDGRSLSVVVRIYKLKDIAAFNAASADSFKDATTERSAFGGDLVDVRELVLTPGQKYEVVEKLSLNVGYLAVAVQFRNPAERRWRFAFETRQAEKSGITLGVHGCAMSVASGEPVDTPPEFMRVAGVRCR